MPKSRHKRGIKILFTMGMKVRNHSSEFLKTESQIFVWNIFNSKFSFMHIIIIFFSFDRMCFESTFFDSTLVKTETIKTFFWKSLKGNFYIPIVNVSDSIQKNDWKIKVLNLYFKMLKMLSTNMKSWEVMMLYKTSNYHLITRQKPIL